jgi:hypothetical protein
MARTRTQRARRAQEVPGIEEALREPETPPQGDIEIQLDDDDPGDLDVNITTPPTERPAPAPRPEPQEEDAVARALEAQRRAEQLQADALRQRDEALRRAQQREVELTRERGDREDAEYNSILTAIAAEQSTIEKATADYAAAASVGDWNAAAQAQRAMAIAGSRLDRLEDGKRTFDSKRQEVAARPAAEPVRQAPTFEQQIAQLPQQAQQWLRNHPEFITDPAKNRKIQTVHGYLTDNKGLTAFSDAYFDAMNSEFGFTNEPAAREPPAQQQPRRSMPMTAPVSREVPTAASGTRKQSSMRLTEEERKVAREAIPDRPDLPKMTNAQKEYLYAKNKAKYDQMKRDGTYDEQRRR